MNSNYWRTWYLRECKRLADAAAAIWRRNPDAWHLVIVGTRDSDRLTALRVVPLLEFENAPEDDRPPEEIVFRISPAWSFDSIGIRLEHGLTREPILPRDYSACEV